MDGDSRGVSGHGRRAAIGDRRVRWAPKPPAPFIRLAAYSTVTESRYVHSPLVPPTHGWL
jgi:hypothetical protein